MAVLRIGSFDFRLNPFALIATLLAIGLMIKLGVWQIERGQEKQRMLTQHQLASEVAIKEITESQLPTLQDKPDERIRAHVTFAQERYFLVENQIHQGRVGYHVVALGQLANSADHALWIPVNLGWIPAPPSRSETPQVHIPARADLTARVHLPQQPFLLQQQHVSQQWPARIQYPELAVMQAHIESELAPFMWRVESGAPFYNNNNAYVRDWPIVSMEPHRHYAYAVQWFGLALAAAVVFLVAAAKRKSVVQAEEA